MSRTLKSSLSRLHPEEIKNEDSVTKEPRRFKVGQAVYVRNYSEGNRWVPAWVVEISGPVSYKVQIEDGTVWRRHVNQMIARQVANVPLPSNSEVLPSFVNLENDITTEESPEEEDEDFESASESLNGSPLVSPEPVLRPQRERRPPRYLEDYDLT